MKKDKKRFICFYSSFSRCVFLFVVTLSMLSGSINAFAVDPTPGVDSDARTALTYQALAAVGFETAGSEAVIEMPNSVAAVTCLTDSVTAALDVTGNIFSGKISEQSSNLVSNSLESHFENFKFSDIISYDTELKYSASFDAKLKIGIGGSTPGPTVKHVECAASSTLWEAKKKRPPIVLPTFADAIQNLGGLEESDASKNQARYKKSGGDEVPSVGSKFIAAWAASSDGIDAAEKLKAESSTFKDRYVDMDVDFSKIKDPCEKLELMSGSSFNCADFK